MAARAALTKALGMSAYRSDDHRSRLAQGSFGCFTVSNRECQLAQSWLAPVRLSSSCAGSLNALVNRESGEIWVVRNGCPSHFAPMPGCWHGGRVPGSRGSLRFSRKANSICGSSLAVLLANARPPSPLPTRSDKKGLLDMDYFAVTNA